MSSKPYRTMTFRDLVLFGGMIALGGCGLLLTLIFLIDQQSGLADGQRFLVVLGAAWGVLFQVGAGATLLRHVYHLGKEVDRLRETKNDLPAPAATRNQEQT